MATLSLAHNTSAPAIGWRFPDEDLRGAFLELEVAWRGGTLAADNVEVGGLSIAYDDGASIVTWAYDRGDADALPLGTLSSYDIYATDEAGRRKISAGNIHVDGLGELSMPSTGVVQIPGIQGPPIGLWAGEWAAGAYQSRAIVSHDNSLWWTPDATDTEPGTEGSVWVLWVDGSDAASDRAAAEAAALSAAQDAAATAADRVAVASDRTAVATAKAAVDTAKGQVDTATTTATTAAGTATTKAGEASGYASSASTSAGNAANDRATVQNIYNAVIAPPVDVTTTTYTLQASDAGKTLRFTHASGCVVTLPASFSAGFYCSGRRIGGPVTWVAASGATKREFPTGTAIAAQGASVLFETDSNVGGAAAAWCIGGAIA